MAKKDKRIKGCPNTECKRHDNQYKYKPTDMFCTLCGSSLIFVCAECFKEIEDAPDMHRYCENCKAEKAQDGGRVPHAFRELGRGARSRAERGAAAVGDAAARGADLVRDKAPVIKGRAVELAHNPKVQQAALEVADIAKEGIKDSKVRRVAHVVIRAAKK